jgi:hypothetical protein
VLVTSGSAFDVDSGIWKTASLSNIVWVVYVSVSVAVVRDVAMAEVGVVDEAVVVHPVLRT